jgi:nucleotide-binding universal stress UspA family protein
VANQADQSPIVVGVDGSPSADDALEWAAAEASVMHRPLHIVHGFIWPLMRVPLGPSEFGPADGGLRASAERLLVAAETRAQLAAPDINVTSELVVGDAAPALLRCARGAELLVVGSRGLGGFLGLLVGSVGVAVAAHAPCPVIVVRPRPDGRPGSFGGRVVVGADGSELSAAAIEFAFQAAARRKVGLTAVRVWTPSRSAHPARIPLDKIEAAERRQLIETLKDSCQQFPDVDVETKLVRDNHPGRALIESSAEAGLIVIGTRGHGGFVGLLLGSVSQSVLEHADCPVGVVRGRPTGSPDVATHVVGP